jgi:peptide chain release factor 1
LTGAGRLVHLAEREGRLLDDARLGHLRDEVVALAAALAYPGEDRVTGVLLGDVPDQLLDDDRLADAGPAEDADLAALLERADQVDDLEAGLEYLDLGRLLVERGRLAVDGQGLLGVDRTLLVDGLAEDVEDATEGRLADRHADRAAGVAHGGAAGEAVGRGHRDGPDPVVAEVLLDLADERLLAVAHDLDGVEDGRQVAGREFDVDDGSGDLDDPTGGGRSGGRHGGVGASLRRASRARWPGS